MKKDLLRRAINLNKKRKYRRGWQTLVRTLAVAVVFCTTYVLILPAITMQEDTVCGMEAHVHTDACYSQPQAQLLGCGIPADVIVVHRHNALCRGETGELICPLAETAVHTHDDGCYTMTCATHVHSDACAKTERILVCEITESEGHTHSESCTGTRSVLTCTTEIHEHGEACYGVQTLACEILESEEHTHSESCTGTQTVLTCTTEVHAHTDDCFDEQILLCEIIEAEGHAHGESCFTVAEIPCTEPTAEGHIHDDTCQQLTCTLREIQLHSHAEACFDAESALICTQAVVVEHNHTEACAVIPEDAEPVLTCPLEEHTHTSDCYPLEEKAVTGLEYHCGFAAHAHIDSCYHNDGTLSCTIPVHAHEAACVVENLDLTADMEWPAIWEAAVAELKFTGIWAEDLLTMARSQIGYTESSRNCILKDDQLQGYTRYADWYGQYYGPWDDMFVSFCLHYADIPKEALPYESDTARWIALLTEKDMYISAGAYNPVPGDLLFWDSDDDDKADKSGIVCEVTEGKQIKIIAGDAGHKKVEMLTFDMKADTTIIGFCPLPVNPMNQEQWSAAEAVTTMLAELPEAETVRENLRKLNDDGDKAGYEALRQEVVSRVEAVETAYGALNDAQKARVTGMERLNALKEVCGGENWQQFAALTDDGAALIQLTVDSTEIIRSEIPAETSSGENPEEVDAETAVPVIPENAVRNLDTIRYTFAGVAESYYTDVRYGEAVVKVELVLPLTQDKAVFDTEAMAWMENSTLTTENRLINETEIVCQVLTGYKRLVANESSGIVVPGSFTETVVVKVVNMTHGEHIALIVSAAMEHNTWNGICEEHQTTEKLTVVTDILTAYAPLDAQTQQANYEAFLLEAQNIDAQNLSDSDQYFAAMELMQRIAEAYKIGGLSEAQYEELSAWITTLSDVNLNTIAEPCIGTNWMKIDFSGELIYETESIVLTGSAQASAMKSTLALSPEVYSATFPSSQQIEREGGEEVSSDNAVMVSKTIEGTDTENVFDITLQIVTQDEVNEVYKDPDMAVVVVMDISNTMRSDFGDVTRYQAAMTAGENFLKKFAQQNSTLSRVGYVAFNTSAHKIFDLSACNTTAQANSLTSTMKSKTGTIINASGYADSRTRFTNMEAGLKMAANMLENVNNQHKYIIFISDGFPTTYVKSGTTGYEPFSSSGTKDNDGVFYDDALNKWCLYGTSYSDTAAIKARQLAVTLKGQGVNIFSIGVDVGGQTLWSYHNQSVNANGFSVVERRNEASYYRENGYEIGTMHSEIDKTSVTNAEKSAMAQDFKDWLKGSASSGIGSGYYYDSTDLSGLNAAYDTIFQKILELNASSSHLDWVATDPMPDMGVHEVEAMEFIGFWDLNENDEWVLVADNLTGESKDGNLYDNTADFHEDTQTIHWDIKKSGYVTKTIDNTTTYLCELRYRVRLKNEESVFVEKTAYDTNDVTTLTYRIIEIKDDQTSISERRTVNFPIPAVEGYLAELNFDKIDSYGSPVKGAEFTLSHDTDACGYCRGDGAGHVALSDFVATSGEDGKVSFTNIPSGHSYTLVETKIPEGYKENGNTYKVTVAYDALSVTITDKDGNVLTWEKFIENVTAYRLPETGGSGTQFFTFGGLLMMAAACVYMVNRFARKRRRGG